MGRAVNGRDRTPEKVIRQAAQIARDLAETARQQHEPEEAQRFEQIAVEGETRARHLDGVARVQAEVQAQRADQARQAGQDLIRRHTIALEHAGERAEG